ncbi:pilus assembly protein [Marinicauda algicola]|uniref:Pilus assembly protein n=1 Tax=Marinicauda algicola TaxID=2029849 RepID=A0A4S2H0W2_9PROT|nr:TadE/TadG family type IV pilus assembly protein [Marinicauda algicola]TGY89033.1 pilus assembly protein [Marinicauda algicola]
MSCLAPLTPSLWARLAQDRRGTSAIEFALVAPVFVILLCATVLLGQAFYTASSLQWAVEATTRDLMIDRHLTEAEFEQRLRTLVSQLSTAEFQVAYASTIYGEIPVTEVTTQVTYPVSIPLVAPFDLTWTIETHAARPLSG